VLAALKMREEMAAINARLSQEGKKIGVGIGISTGEAMVGIFGSAKKKEYTAFGLPVNVASRLEHLALEGQILICERTYELVRELVTVEPMGSFALKGMQRRVDIFNIIGIK